MTNITYKFSRTVITPFGQNIFCFNKYSVALEFEFSIERKMKTEWENYTNGFSLASSYTTLHSNKVIDYQLEESEHGIDDLPGTNQGEIVRRAMWTVK